VQIRCNVATAQILHPRGGRIGDGNAPIVQITIALPHANGRTTLSAGARLSYLTTLADEPRCVMGLEFLDLRPTARKTIAQFFSEQPRNHFATEDYVDPRLATAR
jgi:hypothetical protein